MKLCHGSKSRTLCEWLKESHAEICSSSYFTQAFWFLYALFSKVEYETTNFEILQENAPNLFSCSFSDKCFIEHFPLEKVLLNNNSSNEICNTARKVVFMIKSLNENELTELMNTFRQHKENVVFQLDELYSDELALNSRIIPIGDKRFIFSLTDFENLTKTHHETLRKLSSNQTLVNPVFVEIDEQGRLIVD